MLSKKVLQFILLTFMISWSVALAAYLLHVTYGSILFFVIIAVGYMPAPAYATLIVQKLVYRRSLQPYGFTLKKISLRRLLITTAGFAWFIVLGTFVVIAILGNVFGIALFGRIDFSEAEFLHQLTIFSRGAFGPVPQHVPIPPVAIFQLLQGGWPVELVLRTSGSLPRRPIRETLFTSFPPSDLDQLEQLRL